MTEDPRRSQLQNREQNDSVFPTLQQQIARAEISTLLSQVLLALMALAAGFGAAFFTGSGILGTIFFVLLSALMVAVVHWLAFSGILASRKWPELALASIIGLIISMFVLNFFWHVFNSDGGVEEAAEFELAELSAQIDPARNRLETANTAMDNLITASQDAYGRSVNGASVCGVASPSGQGPLSVFLRAKAETYATINARLDRSSQNFLQGIDRLEEDEGRPAVERAQSLRSEMRSYQSAIVDELEGSAALLEEDVAVFNWAPALSSEGGEQSGGTVQSCNEPRVAAALTSASEALRGLALPELEASENRSQDYASATGLDRYGAALTGQIWLRSKDWFPLLFTFVFGLALFVLSRSRGSDNSPEPQTIFEREAPLPLPGHEESREISQDSKPIDQE